MNQLDLFRGRRRQAKSASETRLQCAIVDLVQRTINKEWRFTHLPMGGKRAPTTAALLTALGTTPGWPDLMFVGPRKVFWLELKRKGGRLSEAQQIMREHLIACGFPYLVTDSFDEAISALKTHSILPPGVRVQ